MTSRAEPGGRKMGQEVTAATPKGIKALRAKAMGMREEGGFRGAVLGGRVDRMW